MYMLIGQLSKSVANVMTRYSVDIFLLFSLCLLSECYDGVGRQSLFAHCHKLWRYLLRLLYSSLGGCLRTELSWYVPGALYAFICVR